MYAWYPNQKSMQPCITKDKLWHILLQTWSTIALEDNFIWKVNISLHSIERIVQSHSKRALLHSIARAIYTCIKSFKRLGLALGSIKRAKCEKSKATSQEKSKQEFTIKLGIAWQKQARKPPKRLAKSIPRGSPRLASRILPIQVVWARFGALLTAKKN